MAVPFAAALALASGGRDRYLRDTYVYEAADKTFRLVFPLAEADVRVSRPIVPGGYAMVMGNDSTTEFGVAVFDNVQFLRGPASVILENITGPGGQGFLPGAVRTDSAIRLGAVEGRAGTITGKNNRAGEPREQVYRVFLVQQRVFHVWATTFRGGTLSPEARAFVASLEIRCDPSRPCGVTSVAGGASDSPSSVPAYFEFQVEKPVRMAPGTAVPRYPDALRASHIDGQVLASFIVDTMGLADPVSFKVLTSTHDEFTEAVRAVLPAMRFIPAEIRGRKVKQLVQQPFVFSVTPER